MQSDFFSRKSKKILTPPIDLPIPHFMSLGSRVVNDEEQINPIR